MCGCILLSEEQQGQRFRLKCQNNEEISIVRDCSAQMRSTYWFPFTLVWVVYCPFSKFIYALLAETLMLAGGESGCVAELFCQKNNNGKGLDSIVKESNYAQMRTYQFPLTWFGYWCCCGRYTRLAFHSKINHLLKCV